MNIAESISCPDFHYLLCTELVLIDKKIFWVFFYKKKALTFGFFLAV